MSFAALAGLCVQDGLSGYEWPALMAGPYLEASPDPAALASDFFARAARQPNPRWIFDGIVRALAGATSLDWPAVLTGMKLVFSAAIPSLFLVVLTRIVERPDLGLRRPDRASALACAGILGLIAAAVAGWDEWVEIGGYPYLDTRATPHYLALTIGLAALSLPESRTLARRTLLFLAGLVHPTVGMCVILFQALSFPGRDRWMDLLVGLASCLLLVGAFDPGAVLPTDELVDAYVHLRHPHHFHVPSFTAIHGMPWWIVPLGYAALFSAGSAILRRRGDGAGSRVSLGYGLGLMGALTAQWLFVDVVPWRWMVMLGPVRFGSFGPWMLLVVLLLVKDRQDCDAADPSEPGSVPSAREAMLVISVTTLAVAALAVPTSRIDPREAIRASRPQLTAWIESTPRDAVFVVPATSPLKHDLPLVHGRALYVSDFFPYRLDMLREYADRFRRVYGRDDDDLAPTLFERALARDDRFHGNTVQDFVDMCRHHRLDYIVLFEDVPSELDGLEATFTGDGYRVYSTERLAARAPPASGG